MNITLNISDKVIEDIFVTALEGGSNYWLEIADDSIVKAVELVPKEPISVALYKAVMEHEVIVPVFDVEDPACEDPIGFLDCTKIKSRLEKLANDPEYRDHLFTEIQEQGDAISSDVCFQYMALGQVIYA